MPTKGIPLPLVSAGGSSLLINLFAIGVLLNVSQHATASMGAASSTRPPGWEPAPEPPPANEPGWSPAA
jgi:cell division protein FtsW